MRSLVAGLLAALSLSACMQTPDYVASTPTELAGGASGVGGAGGAGGAGGGLPENCDPLVTRAFVLFASIEGDCKYPYPNEETEIRKLLEDFIYSEPPADLTQAEAEQANADFICRITRAPWRYDFDGVDITREDITTGVICPRYCKALRIWLDEHRELALSCVPDGNK